MAPLLKAPVKAGKKVALKPARTSAKKAKAKARPDFARATAPITRAQITARAVTWIAEKVPYSQSRWWSNENGRYRQDCSGFVSMAWALNPRQNYWTGNLNKVSTPIASKNLRPGDILNWPRHHVVLFAGWANDAKTKFNLYEQYGTGHSPRFLRNASRSYYLNKGYRPARYDKVTAATSPLKIADGVPLVEVYEWTPELADAVELQTEAPAAAPGTETPEADPAVPDSELVAQQQALDNAADAVAADDLAAVAYPTSGPGPATGILATALALAFVLVPAAVAGRPARRRRFVRVRGPAPPHRRP